MGNEQSVKQRNERPIDAYMYAPVTTRRTKANRVGDFQQGKPFINVKQCAPLLRTAYHGIWSMSFTNTIAPLTRMGQCSVYDSLTDSLIIAYGCDKSGHCLNDVWSLDIKNLSWRPLANHLLSPRQYPSSILINRKMVIYGGNQGNEFYTDLHSIDIDTGEIIIYETHGECPISRTSPILFYQDSRLYVLSIYDTTSRFSVYMLDLQELIWHKLSETHSSLPSPSYCEHRGEFYIFGGSKNTAVTKFHPNDGTFEAFPCTGTEPPLDLSRSSLVSADEYIFLIGGEASYPYMHLYALDTKRQWWFAFHIRPDNDSLSVQDGTVSPVGLFMLPREHSSSIAYSKYRRELISVMGSRMIDPPPVFKIVIGEALSVLHLRSDMFEMFNNSYYY
ncbi:Kelch motif family protein [Histomonas meleagridis]|uniref:Kelch motif family protein n=1 Tax=Histomonas meleagridis TaxID=135588 RepID=UPI00355A3423|nr:Kelch motif family protein [Histomonas meleagridis]KAH0807136.1 Kelch motif family protein [Histomonas meleagridis]